MVDLNSPALIEISQLLAIRQLGKTMGLEDVAEAEDANRGPDWPIFKSEKMGHWWWWTRSVQSPLSKWTGMRPCLSEVRARKTSMPPLWHVRRCTGALDARQPGALHPFERQSREDKAPKEKAEVEEMDGASPVPAHMETED